MIILNPKLGMFERKDHSYNYLEGELINCTRAGSSLIIVIDDILLGLVKLIISNRSFIQQWEERLSSKLSFRVVKIVSMKVTHLDGRVWYAPYLYYVPVQAL